MRWYFILYNAPRAVGRTADVRLYWVTDLQNIWHMYCWRDTISFLISNALFKHIPELKDTIRHPLGLRFHFVIGSQLYLPFSQVWTADIQLVTIT